MQRLRRFYANTGFLYTGQCVILLLLLGYGMARSLTAAGWLLVPPAFALGL